MNKIDEIIEREFTLASNRNFGARYSAMELRHLLREAIEPYKREIEQQFCKAIIATQEPSKTTGRLICDTLRLLAYYNEHKSKN